MTNSDFGIWNSIFVIELLKKRLQINTSVYFNSEIKSKKKGTDNIINILKIFVITGPPGGRFNVLN